MCGPPHSSRRSPWPGSGQSWKAPSGQGARLVHAEYRSGQQRPVTLAEAPGCPPPECAAGSTRTGSGTSRFPAGVGLEAPPPPSHLIKETSSIVLAVLVAAAQTRPFNLGHCGQVGEDAKARPLVDYFSQFQGQLGIPFLRQLLEAVVAVGAGPRVEAAWRLGAPPPPHLSSPQPQDRRGSPGQPGSMCRGRCLEGGAPPPPTVGAVGGNGGARRADIGHLLDSRAPGLIYHEPLAIPP